MMGHTIFYIDLPFPSDIQSETGEKLLRRTRWRSRRPTVFGFLWQHILFRFHINRGQEKSQRKFKGVTDAKPYTISKGIGFYAQYIVRHCFTCFHFINSFLKISYASPNVQLLLWPQS